ncbi:MAG: hypothetical protein GYB65_15870 [Chloroflexi bacterium]|nr:hypothetical protein [Chloroflexota bacterium]
MQQLHRVVQRTLPIPIKHRINLLLQRAGLERFVDSVIKKRRIVVVYQVGKVGSTSVTHSLHQADFSVYQVHEISPARLQQMQDLVAEGYPATDYVARKVDEGRWVYNQLQRGRRDLLFLSLVRDPVAIAVSSFFNNPEITLESDRWLEEYSVDELIDQFFAHDYATSTWFTSWFDRELKPGLGIDVYAHPFDPVRGYTRIQQDNADLMIIKLEADDALKERAIAELTGLAQFRLARQHVRAETEAGHVYRAFKDRLRLPDDILDIHYQTRWATHFYTEDEIAAFRAFWRGDNR